MLADVQKPIRFRRMSSSFKINYFHAYVSKAAMQPQNCSGILLCLPFCFAVPPARCGLYSVQEWKRVSLPTVVFSKCEILMRGYGERFEQKNGRGQALLYRRTNEPQESLLKAVASGHIALHARDCGRCPPWFTSTRVPQRFPGRTTRHVGDPCYV